MTNKSHAVIVLGATGAVGNQVLNYLIKRAEVLQISTLGRRLVPDLSETLVVQHSVDVFDPNTYQEIVKNHQVAICTFGLGEPSKVSKEDFVKIDKTAVISFAKACKEVGVTHFQLLSSVGINAKSASFYLRSKGELVNELEAMSFDRLSIFQPSMIITKTNRYGIAQGITLKVWPVLSRVLFGPLKKFRGIDVEHLGKAFVTNMFENKMGLEMITWEDIKRLSKL
ncbi:NAD(P)H-binding protein [Aureibaculum sp. A20]|uniref:NAD(P)H-binding protein n=1 Tax=Aureibaculum flavum TaxID=2795986 RepID=A0ABS0WT02_9FLAO|nr:NAD(P)H-binding protein [Aureibaculum flavum]MBJ2175093.1 NAD(P)H-binding protein [Aureibaculum flavum]